MKVWTISSKLHKEWKQAAKERAQISRVHQDLLAKYGVDGEASTYMIEGREPLWFGDVPRWGKVEGECAKPDRRKKIGRLFYAEWEALVKAPSWFAIMSKYMTNKGSHFAWEINTIGSVEYIVRAEGYDFTKAGCKLIDI